MRKIQLEAKDQTPWVVLDKEKAILEIRGYSFPDEAHAFYDDIINWFAEYAKDPNPETKLVFDLIYANSTSLKFLNDILKKMDLIVAAGKIVNIEWIYVADDEDLQQLGMILRDFHKVPFTFLPKEVKDS
ncbi:MAG: DUF1987 domain-containing protein [Bacteroidia bacterium]